MSHVDQGALHAYLDGALDELPSGGGRAIREHLAACPECATRLEAEQRIREEALAILPGPLPQFELPPLEELRLRAEATSPARVSRGGRMHRMGWAASVILAIGVGYALRGDPSLPLGTMDSVDGPSVPVLSRLEGRSQSDARADRGSSALSAAAQREQLPLNSVVGVSADESILVASVEESVVAEVESGDPLVADLDFEALQDRLMSVPARTPLVTSALLDITFAAGTAKRLSGELSVPRVQEVSFANEAFDEEREQRRGRADMASASRSAAGAVFSTDGASARPRERRQVARRGGAGGQLVVPGFELIVLENIEEGPAVGGVRTLQLLTRVDTLELLHLPEGVDPADLAAPEQDGISQLEALRGRAWLVMRAPRSTQELEVLLERLDANR
jgi:anti-sigma factor RsiW